MINSSGDVGTWVHTNLATKPTLTPDTSWSNGFAADMAWSDPQYMATIGVVLGTSTGYGVWSGDGGNTWAQFATYPPGVAENKGGEASIAITARNKAVWAPGNSVPSYTTDNGATWVPTNLPAINSIFPRAYHLVADRKNPNKVYAYDSGGHWWGTPGKVYVSTDGGHTFTLSQGSVAAGLAPNYFANTSLAVNPNAEGDLWLADGNAVYRSVDSGRPGRSSSHFASIMGSNPWADVQGATVVALGKAAPGADVLGRGLRGGRGERRVGRVPLRRRRRHLGPLQRRRSPVRRHRRDGGRSEHLRTHLHQRYRPRHVVQLLNAAMRQKCRRRPGRSAS